jgi:hypothetical protein
MSKLTKEEIEEKFGKNLPVTFYQLIEKDLSNQQNQPDPFFMVDKYQGFSKAINYHKPITKLINWVHFEKK